MATPSTEGGRGRVDFAAGFAQPGRGDFHSHARIAQGRQAAADVRQALRLGQPDVELLHGENFDQVRMGRDIEQAGAEHGLPGREIGRIAAFALLLGGAFPGFHAVVKAPAPEKMHAAQEIVEVIGLAGGAGKVLLPVQPVHFHAEKHPAGAVRPFARRGLERQHLAGVVRQMAAEPLTVFVLVVKALRARRVFGKTQQGQALVQG